MQQAVFELLGYLFIGKPMDLLDPYQVFAGPMLNAEGEITKKAFIETYKSSFLYWKNKFEPVLKPELTRNSSRVDNDIP
ncbi:hypothetical protein [Gynurincola endophyticus]|uniref:hypothetical protein n=1 Tax=Gynurincola endophyticus TaxID=2479004 RepID=UPI000F8E24EA|nr:hypothetical protein [Gynurincola endophyticus]